MSDIAIRAEGLSKRYRLGSRGGYQTLRDSLTDVLSAPFRRFSGRAAAKADSESFWALKDVSFDVNHGEVIGIIGRNGAGKSTLLKILSRITEPTEGNVSIHGRIASLLEVGTGFHPELTGRDNIFLNGAILGMRKEEIRRKFDEIVAFAEVEKFIDTPVKHYSSGMYVRLAFAVAAHLDSEILLVDEVLAVGDLGFQKKCLGKMGDVAKTGRTIVLVTHQMNQMRRICERCIWLHGGKVRAVGAVSDILSQYEADVVNPSTNGKREIKGISSAARFIGWNIVDSREGRGNVIDTFGPFAVRFVLEVTRPIRRGHHGIAVLKDGRSNMWGNGIYDLDLEPGNYEFVHSLNSLPLQPGAYSWQVSISDQEGMIDLWDCTPELAIATPPVTHRRDEYAGVLNIPAGFEVNSTTHVPAPVEVNG